MRIKKPFCAFCLLLALSMPAGAWADYTVTEEQLASLETVFSELKAEQETQQTLLIEQQERIDRLSKQLKTSDVELQNSKNQLTKAQEQLREANASLKQYADNARRTENRLKRQRDTWAIFAAITVGMAIARR